MRSPNGPPFCLVRHGGQTSELAPAEFSTIDSLRQAPGSVVWLALRDPGTDDLRTLEDEFGIHELALEDVQKRGQRPKLDTYPDQHMLVLYEAVRPSRPDGAVVHPRSHRAPRSAHLEELHVFTGPGWIVSVQWHDSPAVDAARARLERPSQLGVDGPGGILYLLFDIAADSYFPVLDDVAERMDALEDRVLEGAQAGHELHDMLAIKRELLNLRRVLAPTRDVANALLRRDIPIIDDAAVPYFQDLFDHLVRILDQLDLYRDLLASVVDARLTLTSNALNTIMKRLTAITVILMAPTLIAGIYGMNFEVMPELSWSAGYPLALGLMAAVMIGAYWFFRRHDWF